MSDHNLREGNLTVPTTGRAFLAFQLVDHWGNRSTPRARPRADVLAAVMLGSTGSSPVRHLPGTAPSSVVADPPLQDEQEAEWSSVVDWAAAYGRYVEYLVSHHISFLAAGAGTLHGHFLARQEARRERLVASLDGDARYRETLRGPSDTVNRSIVRVCHAIVMHLVAPAAGEGSIPDVPQSTGTVTLRIRQVAPGVHRLRPWPFAGRRLVVHADGRRDTAAQLRDAGAEQHALSANHACHIAWTLLATGTSAD